MQIPPPDHRSRCGLDGPIAPPRSYVPITAPIRTSKRRPDQGTTNITTHRPRFVTTSMAGPQKQAIPEGFRNLSRFAHSGFGGQNEADRCRSPPPPRPSFSLRVGGPIDWALLRGSFGVFCVGGVFLHHVAIH